MPFTVLRRMDCVLAPHKEDVIRLYEQYKTKIEDPSPPILSKTGTSFFNHSQYDLKRLLEDPGNIDKNLANYLAGFSENVIEIIKRF